MDYAKKIMYQSNYWYNDGLKKAQERDMNGAIIAPASEPAVQQGEYCSEKSSGTGILWNRGSGRGTGRVDHQ